MAAACGSSENEKCANERNVVAAKKHDGAHMKSYSAYAKSRNIGVMTMT